MLTKSTSKYKKQSGILIYLTELFTGYFVRNLNALPICNGTRLVIKLNSTIPLEFMLEWIKNQLTKSNAATAVVIAVAALILFFNNCKNCL